MDFIFDRFAGGLLPGASITLISITWILTAIINLAFAFGVYADTAFLKQNLRRGTFLVSGGIWALATLLGGVFIAAIYWLIHHSTLCPAKLSKELPPRPASLESKHGEMNPEDY